VTTVIAPRRSEIVAAYARLARLRATARPCARCADRRARSRRALASVARRLVPSRERECRWWLVAVVVLFSVVAILLFGLVALLFSGPIAHASSRRT
jgi:uracil-DNA glycosylase